MQKEKKYVGAQHRGPAPERRKYNAEKAAYWRKLKREENLSIPELALREGVSRATISKAFLEF